MSMNIWRKMQDLIFGFKEGINTKKKETHRWAISEWQSNLLNASEMASRNTFLWVRNEEMCPPSTYRTSLPGQISASLAEFEICQSTMNYKIKHTTENKGKIYSRGRIHPSWQLRKW
eukprot:Sdes_comp8909_c0_seq2m315